MMTNNIILINDIGQNEWTIDSSSVHSHTDCYICFKFIDNGKQTVNFRGLTFGYEMLLNNEPIKTGSFPRNGTNFVQTNQEYLVTEYIEPNPGFEYTISVWSTHNDVTYSNDFNVVIPRPNKPYESWTWQEYRWVPPVKRPDDGNFYLWNEDLQDWEQAPDYEI